MYKRQVKKDAGAQDAGAHALEAPKAVGYTWHVAKAAARARHTPARPVPLLPAELMQLTNWKKPEIILRIRFKVWKSRVRGARLGRWEAARDIDAAVEAAMVRLGPSLGLAGVARQPDAPRDIPSRVWLPTSDRRDDDVHRLPYLAALQLQLPA